MVSRTKAAAAFVAAGLAVLGILSGGAANAATTDSQSGAADRAVAIYHKIDSSADPKAAYAGLSAKDRKAFDDYFLPAQETTQVTLTPLDGAAAASKISGAVKSSYSSVPEAQAAVAAASGCWGNSVRFTEYAALGNAIWDVWVDGSWCGNGSAATSATFGHSWSTIAAIGWRDGGQVGHGSGVTSGMARIWAQRNMILGSGGWDVQSIRQCIRMNGWGNGYTTADTTCSIY